jgi:hypothetical protein
VVETWLESTGVEGCSVSLIVVVFTGHAEFFWVHLIGVSGMAFEFEVSPNAESAVAIDEADFIGGFASFYEDAHFESMGISPHDSTGAKPGSTDKVTMLAARYAAGLPLWHDSDCYDHGPGTDEELEN